MSRLYLPQQDEIKILIDDEGDLLITQTDNIDEINNIIIIKQMYIESFLELIKLVVKER
jgi:hypothetical protein